MAGKNVTGITLDRERRLFYRVRDAVDLENALGGESIETALRERGYRRLAAFLWAGLRHEQERLKQDDVVKMLDRGDMDYAELWVKVSDALVASGLMRGPSDRDGSDPTSAPAPGSMGA